MVKTNPKGANFERDIMPWLKVLFPYLRRSSKGFEGSDYQRTGPFAIEAKCHKDMRLGQWMKQAQAQVVAEGKRWAVVVHKRRMFGPQGAYVTMSLEDWVEMVADIKGLELPDDLYPVSDEDEQGWV